MMISDEDRMLIDRMITLRYLFDAIEDNSILILKMPFKIPEVHETILKHILDLVHKDIISLKQTFKQEDIKIISIHPDPDGEFTQYNYICKKYHGYSRYWSYALDMKSSKALEKYLNLNKKA